MATTLNLTTDKGAGETEFGGTIEVHHEDVIMLSGRWNCEIKPNYHTEETTLTVVWPNKQQETFQFAGIVEMNRLLEERHPGQYLVPYQQLIGTILLTCFAAAVKYTDLLAKGYPEKTLTTMHETGKEHDLHLMVSSVTVQKQTDSLLQLCQELSPVA